MHESTITRYRVKYYLQSMILCEQFIIWRCLQWRHNTRKKHWDAHWNPSRQNLIFCPCRLCWCCKQSELELILPRYLNRGLQKGADFRRDPKCATVMKPVKSMCTYLWLCQPWALQLCPILTICLTGNKTKTLQNSFKSLETYLDNKIQYIQIQNWFEGQKKTMFPEVCWGYIFSQKKIYCSTPCILA